MIFQTGDLVQLKSGGPIMTVVFVPVDGKSIKCLWFTTTNQISEYSFLAEVIRKPPEKQT